MINNYYVVDAAGTQFTLVFNIGDWIISNGSTWEKVDNTDAISSVFGRTGAVVGVSTDYSSVGIIPITQLRTTTTTLLLLNGCCNDTIRQAYVVDDVCFCLLLLLLLLLPPLLLALF